MVISLCSVWFKFHFGLLLSHSLKHTVRIKYDLIPVVIIFNPSMRTNNHWYDQHHRIITTKPCSLLANWSAGFPNMSQYQISCIIIIDDHYSISMRLCKQPCRTLKTPQTIQKLDY